MRNFLGNPVWDSLTSDQIFFRVEGGPVVRYPAEVAPFCAVDTAAAVCSVENIPSKFDSFFVGVIPEFPAEWKVLHRSSAVQMMFRGTVNATTGIENEVELGAADAEDLVKLTGLAYPEFFRPETYRLGRYIGVRVEGELVAMAGERMRLTRSGETLSEISGVVTHPAHTGRGFASHLMKRLVESISADGATPFLHTGANNARAIGIYERLGFAITGELAVVKVGRHQQSLVAR